MSENNAELSVTFQRLSDCYILQNLLVQMQTNINLIQQGTTGVTLTVNGADLFQLAVKYYNDATLWTTIARANNLTDPYIQPGTPRTIIIPAKTTDNGGILPS
ncbi:MAG TPA: LysM peptidoglycan-binding domain-containing protein [Cyclobacteriaceae bacterium]|nr:LysM peptidoglycan-binding domain-containing protein [Cyclobacteriaceae bacterium]HNC31469.1 LysM peptidoglycan-binding domain-containing protein [Cyclobacteriaceae bacterium]